MASTNEMASDTLKTLEDMKSKGWDYTITSRDKGVSVEFYRECGSERVVCFAEGEFGRAVSEASLQALENEATGILG